MFKSKLVVSQVYDGSTFSNPKWELVSPLEYESKANGTFVVPVGFQTDFASVPKLPFVFEYFGDSGDACAVLHDYLYTQGSLPRKVCDSIYEEAMNESGINWVKRKAMWLAVRLMGWRYYKK